jgi:peptidyl-prolyl cis-trans isomerase B (cyclophilin B)
MEQGLDRRWIIFAVFALLAAAVVAAVLIGRGGGGGGGGGSSSKSASAEGCQHVEAPPAKHVSFKAPKQVLKKGEAATALIKTNCGSFEIELATAQAPKTTNSFAFLADQGFYNDLTFQRIATGFVIQGGDPLGTGIGGPGYKVDEKPPENLAYTKGVVAMAKSGAEPPGRSGSQFFVVTGADAGLPPEYALVGRVSKGLGVVERIGKLGTPAEKPTQTILMEKVTIRKG